MDHSPTQESELNPDALRRMVRVLSDIAAHPGTLGEKRACLMADIAEYLGAERWMWNVVQPPPRPDAPVTPLAVMQGGFSDDQLAALIAFNSREQRRLPDDRIGALAAEAGRQVTRRIDQLADPEQRDPETEYMRLRRAVGCQDSIYTAFPLPDQAVSIIGLHRGFDRPRFTDQDARYFHVVHSELAWLHQPIAGSGHARKPGHFAGPTAEIWCMLVFGFSRRQIAAELGLGLDAVNYHIRRIFRELGVKSHVELMQRYRHGDGGHAPEPSG